jgi:hypothetical protein
MWMLSSRLNFSNGYEAVAVPDTDTGADLEAVLEEQVVRDPEHRLLVRPASGRIAHTHLLHGPGGNLW